MSENRTKADAADMVKLGLVALRIIFELIKLWRENKDAVSKEDVESLQRMVDKEKNIFS